MKLKSLFAILLITLGAGGIAGLLTADSMQTVSYTHLQTICLDEAHHLRTEWWKALEQFIKEMDGVDLVVLTATPPYASTPAEWKRSTTCLLYTSRCV